jgi:hypothetical protein
MIKEKSFPHNISFKDIERFMLNGSNCNSLKQNHLLKNIIKKIQSKGKSLFIYKVFGKTTELDFHDKDEEYENLPKVEDSPLKRIRENQTTIEITEEINKESVRDTIFYNSLGPE